MPEKPDPVYAYVDNEIKKLRKQLNILKRAHDAVASEQKQSLLATQRSIAIYMIVSTFTLATSQRIPARTKTQITAVASKAKSEVNTSDTPLSVATDFYNKCLDLVTQSGGEIVKLG